VEVNEAWEKVSTKKRLLSPLLMLVNQLFTMVATSLTYVVSHSPGFIKTMALSPRRFHISRDSAGQRRHQQFQRKYYDMDTKDVRPYSVHKGPVVGSRRRSIDRFSCKRSHTRRRVRASRSSLVPPQRGPHPVGQTLDFTSRHGLGGSARWSVEESGHGSGLVSGRDEALAWRFAEHFLTISAIQEALEERFDWMDKSARQYKVTRCLEV